MLKDVQNSCFLGLIFSYLHQVVIIMDTPEMKISPSLDVDVTGVMCPQDILPVTDTDVFNDV